MASRNVWKLKPKTNKNEQHKDFFVFGYACKIFRDDETAFHIDQGKHLIPWMGDENLLVDRYDGRGHLSDLRPYDAEFTTPYPIEKTATERAVEEQCERERYLELTVDIEEEKTREEEEWKRYYEAVNEGGFNAVTFNYDNQYDPSEPTDTEVIEDPALNIPYEIPPGLALPPEVVLPVTMKQHKIIEKTAKCVVEHGPQMEIMIKAKQSDHAQFDFLHYDHQLYPYYRSLSTAIKSGFYVPPIEVVEESPTKERHNSSYNPVSYVNISVNPTPIRIGHLVNITCIAGPSGLPSRVKMSIFGDADITQVTDILNGCTTEKTVSFRPSFSDNGRKITCVALSPYLGVSVTTTMILNINYKPVFPGGILRKNMRIREDDSQKIVLTAHANPPDISYDLRKYGQILTTDTRSRISVYNGILTINRVSRLDKGRYTLLATNDAGTSALTINLKVIEKPKPPKIEKKKTNKISTKPKAKATNPSDYVRPAITLTKTRSARKGSTVVVKCVVVGNPMPKVRLWKKKPGKKFTLMKTRGNTTIKKSNGKRVRLEATITNVTKERDSATYQCTAVNSKVTPKSKKRMQLFVT